MLENISKDVSELHFTPEERNLEHERVRKERIGIEKMNISEGEKSIMKDTWLDYMMIYDLEYMKRQKTAIEKSPSLLN